MNRNSKRLLFLFSDTGGGHRSAASAVAQALRDLHGERAQVELVDALADYALWPFNRLGKIYPYLVRLGGWGWAAGYRLSDGPRRIGLLTSGCWPLARAGLRRLLRDHPADLIVCCHPILNHLLLRALAGTRTPLITLITDLNTAHAFWVAPGVACCLAPTARVQRCALTYKLPAERVIVTGLPVSPAFVAAAQQDRLAARRGLGLRPDLPVALLVNGAEGMGALYRISRAIVGSGVQAQLVMIAGRNGRLQNRLRSEAWPLPVRVEGFVRNMHEWMRAADLLVAKAGPSTISEALVMGLPIVLNGALPGQERPSVDYVVRAGAGVWAPTPRRTAAAVRELLSPGNPKLTQMAACAQSLAQPGAARHAAQIIWAAANNIDH
ncbi:MAG: galactosyldiacylglycerol synthase [Chloroflexi bacterium]|nr:MAG: hypothetical protein B6I35_04835 [Anaerolineaceae bacterium 4572_32.2]RLC78952.1 MAG: galactosyldiacylglycerol synthase [Chloroflexota bacterium]RLC79004.1 MAG: galactosyldiacylglycerol synthase [Chloroflexota bacterium]HEY72855.1 glycosyltransferase [Thermoflexia bacterium]